MPLLLILPLLMIGIIGLWAILLPLSILQRYRYGKARRRALPWVVRVNTWMLLLSVPLFLLGAWVSQYWFPGAVRYALMGLGVGGLVGILGVRITRFEPTPGGLYYTPQAWLVLLLTLLVAGRIGLGLWQLAQRWHLADQATLPALLADHASLYAMGGLLLGYYLAYTWGLKRRLR